MSGYWEPAISKAIGSAIQEYDDDWDEQTLSFTLGLGHVVTIEFDKMAALAKLLGTTEITLEAKGDGRYGGEGGHTDPYYAQLNVFCTHVKFPGRP